MAKKKEHHEEHADESWLIPYADLLTLLLALFIVLFASSQVDQQKFTEMKTAFFNVFQGGAGVIGTGGRGYGPGTGSGYSDGSGVGELSNPTSRSPAESPITQTGPAATTGTGQPEVTIPPVNPELIRLQKEFSQYIDAHQLHERINSTITGQSVMITISDVVLFDSGSAEIKPAFYETVQAIGSILAEQPDLHIEILGHTDSVPITSYRYATNWDLSAARAISFMKVLLQDQRLDPAKCTAIGCGEYKPVDTNATEAGRARNRRVEVTAHFMGK